MNIKKIGIDTDYSSYEEFKERYVVAQGWCEVGDLSFFQGENFEPYLEHVTYGEQKGYNAFRQLFKKISPGDILLAFEGNGLKGIAEMPKEYEYFYDERYGYANSLFPLKWIDWQEFCKNPSLKRQGGQGVPGIVDCGYGAKDFVKYIEKNWENYKQNNNINIQPPECDEKLKELQSTKEDRIRISKKNFLNKIQIEKNKEVMNSFKSLLLANHNLILTGAPGTGKTYLAKQIAQQMIFEGVKEKMSPEEEKQFNEQCEFVQFHPSYDYTDFVEGLRPKQDEDDSGNIGFERKDGVFKEFCRKALLCSESNETDIFNGINDNPKVWKVSLSRTGENEIRTYCKENNCIRIGWEEYGNVEDFSEYNFKESEVAKDFQSKGLAVGEKILKSFQHEMKIGDFVVSCYSDKETDAIGIITDDYEYIKEMKDNYPRCRKVNWIWKGVPVDITELNKNKKLTLSTIYKLDIDPLVLKDFIKKRMGYAENKDKERKFVFIIDEINRGEISKIFGELFFSIDPGYRGAKGKVQTQYQNLIEDGDVFKEGFYVPENVYIIGTMNDIDRSVESMDFAFRRRFAFKEIKADDNVGMLEGMEWKEVAIKKMKNLNDAISVIEGLSSAYHIGASYFLKLENYNGDFNLLWEYHLEGLIREYLRGMQDVENKILELKKAYNGESANNGQQQTQTDAE